MIPLELQPAYEGRTKLVRSLDTSDWREASRKGAAVWAQLLQDFEEKARSLKPEPVAQITPELGQTIGTRIRARMLEMGARSSRPRHMPVSEVLRLQVRHDGCDETTAESDSAVTVIASAPYLSNSCGNPGHPGRR